MDWERLSIDDLCSMFVGLIREAASLMTSYFIQVQAFPYWEKPMSVSVAELRDWRKVETEMLTKTVASR